MFRLLAWLQLSTKARNGMDSYQSLWTLVAYEPVVSATGKAVPLSDACVNFNRNMPGYK